MSAGGSWFKVRCRLSAEAKVQVTTGYSNKGSSRILRIVSVTGGRKYAILCHLLNRSEDEKLERLTGMLASEISCMYFCN